MCPWKLCSCRTIHTGLLEKSLATLWVQCLWLLEARLFVTFVSLVLTVSWQFHILCDTPVSDISPSVIVSLVFLWVFAFLSGTATYFIWTQLNPEACSVLTAPLESTVVFLVLDLLLLSVICVFMYAKIFQISRQHANRLKRTTPGWVNEKGDSFILVRKATRTLGLLVGAFATAHLPFLVFHALDGAFEEKLPHRFYVGSVVKCLTFTTSTLNWALYGFLNLEYKRALIKFFGVLGFRCWIFRRGVSPINSGVARTVSMAGKNNFWT